MSARSAFARQHTTAIAVLLLVVLVGGITTAVLRRSSTSDGSPSAGATPSAGASEARLRGKIVSFTDDRLTVRSKGREVVVTVGATTRFGNKAHPATRSDLRPGVVVVIVGPTTGATRILVPTASSTPTPAASAS